MLSSPSTVSYHTRNFIWNDKNDRFSDADGYDILNISYWRFPQRYTAFRITEIDFKISWDFNTFDAWLAPGIFRAYFEFQAIYLGHYRDLLSLTNFLLAWILSQTSHILGLRTFTTCTSHRHFAFYSLALRNSRSISLPLPCKIPSYFITCSRSIRHHSLHEPMNFENITFQLHRRSGHGDTLPNKYRQHSH
jgi:hypothetical protein